MSKKIEMAGKRFGRLIVIEEAGKDKHGHLMWRCLCDCGAERKVDGLNLRAGRTQSCGCYQRDIVKEHNTKHGLAHHPIYTVWRNMLQRCYLPTNVSYENYGERGIMVCSEWKNSPIKFIDWAELNGWQMGLEIDRYDNDQGYCPDNCRFVTRSDNELNTRLLSSTNSTGFRGVSWHKGAGKYRASIKVDGKTYHFGFFTSAIEAARSRDRFVIKRGIHTPLNFQKGL